ncbi:MAG: hypothetical protein JRI68_35690 [Deltaproteobacteria bacterium]|nr:hypothetical protein [Deltaproteobacteria bacterium]
MAVAACDGTTEDGDSCAGYANVTGATAVTLVVDNQSTQDVWLANPTCSPSEFTFTLAGEEQSQRQGNCSCEGQQTDEFACMFTCDGPSHTLTLIPAGAQHEWTWSGETHTSREMPQECYADQVNEWDSCAQVVPATAGTHTVNVDIFTGVTCTPMGGGDCTCTPSGAAGSCSLQVADFESTGESTLSEDFEVPSDTTVTLTVQ